MQYYVLLGLFTIAAAYPGLIHHEQLGDSEGHQELIGESGHHHQVEHAHAKSHQSIKFEHFHPVPVYVKKEHSHLLKHPLEKGKHEQELKQIHPETHHSHGGGLVLEDHRLDTEHLLAGHGHGGFGGGLESIGHIGLEHGGLEGGLEHGLEQGLGHGYEGGYEIAEGYGGGEGIKAYSGIEESGGQGHYYSGQGGEGYGHY